MLNLPLDYETSFKQNLEALVWHLLYEYIAGVQSFHALINFSLILFLDPTGTAGLKTWTASSVNAYALIEPRLFQA